MHCPLYFLGMKTGKFRWATMPDELSNGQTLDLEKCVLHSWRVFLSPGIGVSINTKEFFVRIKHLLSVFAIFLVPTAMAGGVEYLKYSDLLASKDLKDAMEKEVTLHWKGEERPAFVEYGLPESHTSVSKSFSGASRRNCSKAFAEAMDEFISEAESKGYDGIVDIVLLLNGSPSMDAQGFNCKLGESQTTITLTGRLALSEMTAGVLAATERKQLSKALRKPSEKAIFLPFEPVMNSPQAKAILGDGITADWHSTPPAYAYRKGPIEYEGEADISSAGKEDACNRAVLRALEAMVEEAKGGGYDQLIKVRSYMDSQFVADPSQFECSISRKSVSVNLQTSLAAKK